jgi:hypothetical protein
MKMFMISLDGDARQWYKYLLVACIASLKDMHCFILITKGFIHSFFLKIVVSDLN